MWPNYTVNAPATSFVLEGIPDSVQWLVRMRTNCSQCSVTQGTLSQYSTLFTVPPVASKNAATGAALAAVTPSHAALSVYPNPARDLLMVHFTAPDAPDAAEAAPDELRVYDIYGRLISVHSLGTYGGLAAQAGSNTERSFTLNTADWPEGVVLLRFLRGGNEIHTLKQLIRR
jgi:hypothetical protein